jgi:hypothetical protein
MSFTGYRIYRGLGGPANVDFDHCLAEVAGPQASLAGLGHDNGRHYTYIVRPVLDGLETPSISCQVRFRLDETGHWPGPAPEPARSIQAEVLPGRTVRLSWRPDDDATLPSAESFDVLAGHQPRRDLLEHIGTVLRDGRDRLSYTFTPDGDGPWYFTIRARSGDGVAAGAAPIIGPVMAAGPACPAPSAYISDRP